MAVQFHTERHRAILQHRVFGQRVREAVVGQAHANRPAIRTHGFGLRGKTSAPHDVQYQAMAKLEAYFQRSTAKSDAALGRCQHWHGADIWKTILRR